MSNPEFCPRAVENGGGPNSPFNSPYNGEMTWREDDTCSYCGSLNPATFMARLEAGDVELTPTDKNYKVYADGAGLRGHSKFYFQHLNEEQKQRFIELYNERKLKMAYPGHFYVLPFFCRPA